MIGPEGSSQGVFLENDRVARGRKGMRRKRSAPVGVHAHRCYSFAAAAAAFCSTSHGPLRADALLLGPAPRLGPSAAAQGARKGSSLALAPAVPRRERTERDHGLSESARCRQRGGNLVNSVGGRTSGSGCRSRSSRGVSRVLEETQGSVLRRDRGREEYEKQQQQQQQQQSGRSESLLQQLSMLRHRNQHEDQEPLKAKSKPKSSRHAEHGRREASSSVISLYKKNGRQWSESLSSPGADANQGAKDGQARWYCAKRDVSQKVQARILAASTPGQVMELVLANPGACNHVNVATSIHRVGKLIYARRGGGMEGSIDVFTPTEQELFSRLLVVVSHLLDAGVFTPRHLANMSWGLAKVAPSVRLMRQERQQDQQQDQQDLAYGDAWSRVMYKIAVQFTESLLGTVRGGAEEDHGSSGSTAKSSVKECNPQELSMITWAFASCFGHRRQRERDTVRTANVAKSRRGTGGGQKQQQERQGEGGTGGMNVKKKGQQQQRQEKAKKGNWTRRPVMQRSLALGHVDDLFEAVAVRTVQLLEAEAAVAAAEKESAGEVGEARTDTGVGSSPRVGVGGEGSSPLLKMQELATLAWSYASYGHLSVPVSEAIADGVQRRQEQSERQRQASASSARAACWLSPQDASMLAWAFGVHLSRYWQVEESAVRVMQVVVPAAKEGIQSYNTQDTAEVLIGMAKMGWDDAELLSLLAQHVCRGVRRFSARELSNMAWAFARLDFKDAAFLKALPRAVGPAVQRGGMKVQELANLAWALAVLELPEAGLIGAIFRQLEEREEEVPEMEMRQLYQVWLVYSSVIPLAFKQVSDRFLCRLRDAWAAEKARHKRSSMRHLSVSKMLLLMRVQHCNECSHDIDISIVGVGIKDGGRVFKEGGRVFGGRKGSKGSSDSGRDNGVSRIDSSGCRSSEAVELDPAAASAAASTDVSSDGSGDSALPLSAAGDVEPSSSVVAATAAAGTASEQVEMRVAVEIDGPDHFTRNTRRNLGPTELKHRILRSLHYEVVQIPFFEWDPVPFWASMEKKRYLQRKLGIERTLMFGQRDWSNFAPPAKVAKTTRFD